ncbi:MAG: APC family permease [Yoonia sp.]|uniref:APC family permease n=1 Tax=Yoonia sp. TaxID=2212373 RepID=UPI003EF7578D
MTDTVPPQPKLRRALNVPLLTLYGLGVTVGAGIYVLVGATAAQAGPYAPVAFLLAAIVVAFTAFSYAELSTRYPVSAGEAAYVEAGFRKEWMTVGVGLAVAASGIISASAVTIGAASYLQPLTGLPVPVLTFAIVVVMGLIALWGITQSVLIAGIVTVIEVSGLAFVIYWGFGMAAPEGVPLVQMIPPLTGPHWMGVATASVLAFFAFVGFEDMANVAEEVKDPIHTMPRAIIATLVLASVIYFGVAAAVLYAVPLDVLGSSSAPLALVFAGAPEALQQGFGVVAVVATVNGVLIQMIMASRVLYGLGDRGHLPAAFASVTRTQTPLAATLFVAGLIMILTQTLPIAALAAWTSQVVLAIFVLVNVALIRIKHHGPPMGAYFRVPLVVPYLGLMTSALLLAVSFI